MYSSLAFFLLSIVAVMAQVPAVTIDRAAGTPRLTVRGSTGEVYAIDGLSALGGGSWLRMIEMPLTNSVQTWLDSSSPSSNHFYRSGRFAVPPSPPPAWDFRLIDHQGISHELFYYTTNRAIVLIFTGNQCETVHNFIPTIRALRDEFASQGVLFWMVDPSLADNRSNIVVEATALGIDWPILHDDAQIVARTFGATVAPEIVAIGTRDWTSFFRGAIDDRAGSATNAATQSYLRSALLQFLSSRTVSPSRTPPTGCPVQYRPSNDVTYATTIAPLLQAKCVRCHSPGNIAPWSMTNYGVVKLFADSIKTETLANRMPPWHADPWFQSFTNDTSLSVFEKSDLLRWIDAGAPRGAGSDPLTNNIPPATPWPLGTPTNVLSIAPQTISATGSEPYHYVNVTTTFPTDVWLRAAVVRPGNRRVLHHCLVYFGSNSFLRGLDGFFAGYVPGTEHTAFPAGTGKFLPRGTVLQFQLHYTTTGTVETDQTQIGLYTMPVPPTYELLTRSAYNVSFSIPPGEPDYQVTSEYPPFTRNVRIFEMSPHMHYRGARFRFEAVFANGQRETLLSVPKYDFSWQANYRLTQPRDLPAGTKLVCTGAFDNSAQNLSNPDPTARIGFGEQTTNEMFIGYFNYSEVP